MRGEGDASRVANPKAACRRGQRDQNRWGKRRRRPNRCGLLTGVNATVGALSYPEKSSKRFQIGSARYYYGRDGCDKIRTFLSRCHRPERRQAGREALRRLVNHKIYDLLLRGQATAKANGRDVIDPHDLPITKGLRECIHAFAKLNGEIELNSILDHITARPPLDLAIRDETEARLAAIAGGLSVALARAFKLIDSDVKHPTTEDWERALQIFDLLL